jgi:hypothetical protein
LYDKKVSKDPKDEDQGVEASEQDDQPGWYSQATHKNTSALHTQK